MSEQEVEALEVERDAILSVLRKVERCVSSLPLPVAEEVCSFLHGPTSDPHYFAALVRERDALRMVVWQSDKIETALRAPVDAERDALRREVAALQAIIDLLPADALAVAVNYLGLSGFRRDLGDGRRSSLRVVAGALQTFADAVAARKGA